MNKKVKKLWIKALTNGHRKQCRDMLHDGKGFCCLGVLCDLHRIHVLKKPLKVVWKKIDGRLEREYSDTEEMCKLPPVVQKWAGLRSADPRLKRHKKASVLNDGNMCRGNEGLKFKEIAKLIKKKL